MKTSRYLRERSKYQQPSTNYICLFCGAEKAENCHLISWYDLRSSGFPPEEISLEWNLIPLCRECHWLLDNRLNIWVGSKLKKVSLRGKSNEILDKFGLIIKESKILKTTPIIDEDNNCPMPFLGDINEVEFVWGEGTLIRTKLGDLITNKHLEKVECKKIELLFKELISKFNPMSGKEYKKKRNELIEEFGLKKAALETKIYPRIQNAMEKSQQLMREKLRICEMEINQNWDEDLKISGFDIKRIRDGKIKVFLWKK